MFIDFLEDETGETYEYGSCMYESEDGTETGCGMEYAYYEESERLDFWHSAVGLTSSSHFTKEDREELERQHQGHEQTLTRED